MKQNKIRTKFFVLVMAIFAPLIIFEMSGINSYKQQIIQSKIESSVYLSQAISNSFEEYIDSLWIQADIISTYILDNPSLSNEESTRYLNKVMDKQKTVQNLFWLDINGVIIASSDPSTVGKSLAHRTYIAKIREGEDRVLSGLTNSFINSEPILPIAKAIRQDNSLAGIIVMSIDLEKLGSQFSDLLLDEGDAFTLIDRNGIIVYNNEDPGIFKYIRRIDNDSPVWEALEGSIVKSEKQFFENQGLYKLVCSYPINSTGWALSIESNYDSIIDIVQEKTGKTIAVFEILLLFSLIMTLFIGDSFVRPIIKLKDTAYSIMHGDYSARTNIKGNDEIAITAQTFDKMAESIEKYDNEKSQFFVNLSHELKTPLNVILSSLQLIDKVHNVSETCHNYRRVSDQLSLMKQNCYRLVRMVSNLIDLSRHDNGYLNLKLKNCNVISLIEDITMSIVKFAENKRIEVVFDTEMEEKIMACDPDAIERIMLNLISNALKFTNEGGSIYVNIYDKENSVLVSVKDTGIGIPEDKLESIFERFKQVDSSLCRSNEGSGIGLSLVKALVEAHGGSIKATSVLNEGSEFIVELPIGILEEIYLEKDDKFEKKYNSHNGIVEKINLELSDIYGFNSLSNKS